MLKNLIGSHEKIFYFRHTSMRPSHATTRCVSIALFDETEQGHRGQFQGVGAELLKKSPEKIQLPCKTSGLTLSCAFNHPLGRPGLRWAHPLPI
jgi:hypothetical protein